MDSRQSLGGSLCDDAEAYASLGLWPPRQTVIARAQHRTFFLLVSARMPTMAPDSAQNAEEMRMDRATRINFQMEHDVHYWARHLGITEKALRSTAFAVGSNPARIRERLLLLENEGLVGRRK